MPLTAIEEFIFHRQNRTHGVTSFIDVGSALTITVAPWDDFAAAVTVIFHEVSDHTVELLDSNEDSEFPWDIIGFDSYREDDDRWRFVLCCREIENIWHSKWPVEVPSDHAGTPARQHPIQTSPANRRFRVDQHGNPTSLYITGEYLRSVRVSDGS